MDAAVQEVYSRFNAIFYLATVRYIGVSYNDVAEGKDPGTHLVEALAFYQSIQPEVAQANPDADAAIVAFLDLRRTRLRPSPGTRPWPLSTASPTRCC